MVTHQLQDAYFSYHQWTINIKDSRATHGILPKELVTVHLLVASKGSACRIHIIGASRIFHKQWQQLMQRGICMLNAVDTGPLAQRLPDALERDLKQGPILQIPFKKVGAHTLIYSTML